MNELALLFSETPLDEVLVFLVGLLFGSFFNVCIYRLPEEKSVFGGRSQCRSCGKQIPWYLNVPVLSFLFLRGRSACCRKPISIQYPFVEITTGLLFLVLYLHFGWGARWLFYTVFCSSLLVLSVIDYHHQIIPDELSLSGIPLGFLASVVTEDVAWSSSLLGIVAGGGVFFTIAWLYERFSGREGLGGGDVKLLAMLGAWLGVESILVIIVLSTFLGSLVGIALMAFGKADSKAAIPFGPFLAIAAVTYLFFRDDLLPYFYPVFYAG